MPNIFEQFITASNIKYFWDNSKRNVSRLGEAFFPNERTTGLKLEWVKGASELPVALVAANWDTDVLYRDRIGFEELSAEMPFFKEAYKISEKLRQEILQVKENLVERFFGEIFNDVAKLLEGADVTAERMRMQLLSQGNIAIAENGVAKNYNYGFNSTNQLITETTLWSASGATPLKSLIARIKAYKTLTKKTPKYAIMNSDVLDKLISDTTITTYFQNLSTPNLYPTDEAKKSYVEQVTGLTIFVDEDEYIKARDTSKTAIPFYPQDRYTLFAESDLGTTYYSTTPEEVDAQNLSYAASVEITSKGVAITTWAETDPVTVSTKVSQVVLPSCPKMDQIYIVKVL